MHFTAFVAGASLLASAVAQSSVLSELSAVPSAISAASSAVVPSAASSASSAAAPSGSAAPVYAFDCPEGLLTYYLTVQQYTGIALSDATTYFKNWTYAVTGELLNNTGSGDVGATRTYSLGGGVANVSEMLTFVNSSSSTGSLHQLWVSTAPITIGEVTLSNFTDSLTVYTNTTTNETTAQLFINACLNNQTSGLPLLAQALDAEVSGWYSILQNMTSASASGSASASASAAPSTIAEASGSGVLTTDIPSTASMISVSASA